MNKAASFALVITFAGFLSLSITSAYAQYFGGGSETVTKDQQDFCDRYNVNPCTENNILAKERVLGAQNSPSNSGQPTVTGSTNNGYPSLGEPTVTDNGDHTGTPTPIDWSTMGLVVVAVVAVVAVAIVAIKIKRPTATEKV